MISKIVFADKKIKESYEKLKAATTEDRMLYDWLSRAFEDIQRDAFCGIQIPKRLIPREYIKKYGIDNLWKYDMPKAWRLLYSVSGNKVIVISIIIEWLPHKKYETRFGYKVKLVELINRNILQSVNNR